MATNDDLDDFFKKKDRKSNKHKKQVGLLTNNQELLKQLEIVTSATTAFKENLDFDEDDEELLVNDAAAVAPAYPAEEIRKHPIKSNKPKLPDHNHKQDQEIILSHDGPQQQDEWEDFESSNDKYEQLRLKFASAINDNDDEFYDDENNPHNNDDNSDLTGDRQQNKDKPAWKLDQIKKEQETKSVIVEEKPNEIEPSKPSTAATSGQSGAYRPPHARGSSGSSVTVITNVNNQRPTKKKEPNLSSIDEFPTLGAAVNKK